MVGVTTEQWYQWRAGQQYGNEQRIKELEARLRQVRQIHGRLQTAILMHEDGGFHWIDDEATIDGVKELIDELEATLG